MLRDGHVHAQKKQLNDAERYDDQAAQLQQRAKQARINAEHTRGHIISTEQEMLKVEDELNSGKFRTAEETLRRIASQFEEMQSLLARLLPKS